MDRVVSLRWHYSRYSVDFLRGENASSARQVYYPAFLLEKSGNENENGSRDIAAGSMSS
jgi:hypothetical protein